MTVRARGCCRPAVGQGSGIHQEWVYFEASACSPIEGKKMVACTRMYTYIFIKKIKIVRVHILGFICIHAFQSTFFPPLFLRTYTRFFDVTSGDQPICCSNSNCSHGTPYFLLSSSLSGIRGACLWGGRGKRRGTRSTFTHPLRSLERIRSSIPPCSRGGKSLGFRCQPFPQDATCPETSLVPQCWLSNARSQ